MKPFQNDDLLKWDLLLWTFGPCTGRMSLNESSNSQVKKQGAILFIQLVHFSEEVLLLKARIYKDNTVKSYICS